MARGRPGGGRVRGVRGGCGRGTPRRGAAARTRASRRQNAPHPPRPREAGPVGRGAAGWPLAMRVAFLGVMNPQAPWPAGRRTRPHPRSRRRLLGQFATTSRRPSDFVGPAARIDGTPCLLAPPAGGWPLAFVMTYGNFRRTCTALCGTNTIDPVASTSPAGVARQPPPLITFASRNAASRRGSAQRWARRSQLFPSTSASGISRTRRAHPSAVDVRVDAAD